MLVGPGLRPYLLNPAPHLRAWCEAKALEHYTPVPKNREIRNSLDSKPCRKFGVLFRINLEDNSSSYPVTSERFNFGWSHAARRAPQCPEIKKRWNSRVPNDAIECSNIYVDRAPQMVAGLPCRIRIVLCQGDVPRALDSLRRKKCRSALSSSSSSAF